MGMESTHDFADYTRTFNMASVGTKTHLAHLEQDPSLHRFKSIAGIWQGT
jgi:hypothetical protein